MKFKVEIIRRCQRKGNPFYPIRIDGTGQARIRTWEMDCEDEAEVRRFFAEAQAEGHANVVGFELHSITPVPNVTEQARAGSASPASAGWRRCAWAEGEQHRRRLLTGSIGLEGPWSEWTDGKPEKTLMQFEYEYRRRENGA